MEKFIETNYIDVEENKNLELITTKVIEQCFKEEGLEKLNIYINIIFTTPAQIRKFNKEFRNIDKETDVLSFPMFQKEELVDSSNFTKGPIENLGDIIISIQQVEKQAEEYQHSFERELSYMVVHGFYHLMGYDHMEKDEKIIMREKEENILSKLKISR